MARGAGVPPPSEHPLVERADALAVLTDQLAAVTERRGRFVVVRGEAGIGKTALVRAFRDACPADLTVLSGSCDGVSTPQPFGPLEDMVPQLGPRLRELLDGNVSRPEVGRWLMRRLASGPAHALIIEDVQSADEATLELLVHVARRIDDLPVIVVVTVRDDDATSPSVMRALGSLATLPVVRQLRLEPLSRDGIGELAAERNSGVEVDIDELHRVAGGNPFYVIEVLDAGVDRMPTSVLDAVRARVARLAPHGRRALEAAAVIGVRAEPWLLAAIAGEDMIGIDQCQEVGLLTKSEGIAFRHELTRRAVLADLPVVRGISLHRAALAALERAGTTDAARLAYHAEGAGEGSSVVRYGSAAARRARAMGALQEAIAQYRRALRFSDGLGLADRAELVEDLAGVLFNTNRLSEALDAGRQAVALRRELGDTLREGIDLTSLALTAWTNGLGDEAWRYGRRAVALLAPHGEGRAFGMALVILGRLGVSAGLFDDAVASSERGMAIGRRIDDPEVSAIGLANLATVDLLQGGESGWAGLEESLRIGREAGLRPVVDRALNNLGMSAAARRRLDLAEYWFGELEEHSERSEIERCSVDAARAEIALARGDWSAAEHHARAAFVAARTDPIDHGLAIIVLARLAMRRGEGGWQASLAEPTELAERLDTTQLRLPLAALAAEHAWLAGDESALPGVRSAYDLACRVRSPWAIGELGQWLCRAGVLSTLDEHAAMPYRLWAAGRVDDAISAWTELGMPYEAALCRADSADPAEVRRAFEALTALGASAAAKKVGLRLRELGQPVPRGPRPTTRANPAGLTEREVEVAWLLADGLSNAEIAERLVLSPRTVGHHVAAVFDKLDVHRRSQVAAAIRGVVPPV